MTDEIFSLRVDRMILHWAIASPARVALRTHENIYSYEQLRSCVLHVCEEFRALDEAQGSVGVFSDDVFFVLCCVVAAIRIGRRFVVLNSRWPQATLDPVLRDAEVRYVVAKLGTQLPDSVQNYRVKLFDLPAAQSQHSANQLQESRIYHASEVCCLLTAGSQGLPAVVKKTHHSLISELIAWVIEFRLTSRSITGLAQPLYYTGAMLFALATLLCGGTVVFCRSRPEATFCGDIRDLRPSHLLLIPSQYRRLRRLLGVAKLKALFENLDVLLSLGDRLSIEARKDLHEIASDRFIEMWGNTEGLGTLRKSSETSDVRSVGRPFIGDDIFIRNIVGKDVDGNSVGHISGKSDAGAPWLGAPGVIDSKDLGYIRDHNLYLAGRESDVFVGPTGRIVSSWDVERALESLQCAVEIALVQRDNASLLILVARAKADQRRVISTTLEPFLRSNQISDCEVRFVDELPLTDVGKVDRGKIRQSQ
jgi:acyl-coenzyme A synthetase/AMP-(fatty) acid ligase